MECGNAGCSGGPVVTTLVCVPTVCARGFGSSGHPAFPTPSVGRKILAQPGRIAPRDPGGAEIMPREGSGREIVGRNAGRLPGWHPTISCINISRVPQVLGHFGPMCYPATTSFRSPHRPTAPRLTGCGGGDFSPMSSSSSSAKTASAPDSFFTAGLTEADPDIAAAIRGELGRQRHEIELIASENIVSRAVLEAQGSVLTNKYAEGYPGNRYYGGCEWGDGVEPLAIERAKKLFGAGFANVQANSGSQMNQAVFLALLQPGDTFMGLDLAAGGHLTHGSPVNLSGKWFKASHYTVRREDQIIDMDAVANQAEQVRPKLIIAGGSAYSRSWDFKRFREIADSVGAYLLVDMAHFACLVAGGVHAPPVPAAHVTTTTTPKSLRGPRGGLILWNDEALTKKLNSAIFPGLQGGPLMHVIAAKAVAFADELHPHFQVYAKNVVENAT